MLSVHACVSFLDYHCHYCLGIEGDSGRGPPLFSELLIVVERLRFAAANAPKFLSLALAIVTWVGG